MATRRKSPSTMRRLALSRYQVKIVLLNKESVNIDAPDKKSTSNHHTYPMKYYTGTYVPPEKS